MPSSLGVYIDNNVIKYAKVTKSGKGSYKVDSFNVEFYDDLGETIKKILQDTNSYKIPIGINISDELYNYYQVFAMLSKKDMKDSIDIDFESDCVEKNYNLNSLEARYLLTGTNVVGAEQLRALHISARKGDLGARIDKFAGARVSSAAPITTSITNLLEINPKENIAIVNIENDTKITTVIDGEISEITILEDGMGKILETIAQSENSLKKAYEVCKNIPIYNQQDGGETQEGDHAQEIMPILYKIATESKKVIDESKQTIDRVFITGAGTVFSGIDLYFGDYMVNVKCELLKPFFAESSSIKVPIKEYMEVNSAIALAMDALGDGIKDLNFATGNKGNREKIDFNAEVNMNDVVDKVKGFFSPKNKGEARAANVGGVGDNDLIDNVIIRLGITIIIAMFAFTTFSFRIDQMIDEKSKEVGIIQAKNTEQLAAMEEDINEIKGGYKPFADSINEYKRLIESQESVDEQRIISKDAIPNMLNRIMFLIPQKARLISITNNEGSTHIVIVAESQKYEQLGYFTSVLKTEGVLVNVKSTSGSKEDATVRVTIEGDLP